MPNQKHTPGPWTRNGTYIRNSNGRLVTRTLSNYFQLEENTANARLIAAAPDLLDACHEALELIQAFRKEFNPVNPPGRVEKKLLIAIHKTTGENHND